MLALGRLSPELTGGTRRLWRCRTRSGDPAKAKSPAYRACGATNAKACRSQSEPETERLATPLPSVLRRPVAPMAGARPIGEPGGLPTGRSPDRPAQIPASRCNPASKVGGGRGGPPLASSGIVRRTYRHTTLTHQGSRWYSRRPASSARPAFRIAARGAVRPVISSTCGAAWCTSRSKPLTATMPACCAAAASRVGHG